MNTNLNSGIQIAINPTKQFKTTRIELHFVKEANRLDLSSRTLFTNILETSSKKYPTQIDLTHALSELFGASFSAWTAKRGKVHEVVFAIMIPSSKIVQSTDDLLRSAVEFLTEIIFNPLRGKDGFDDAVFERQKINLINYIASAQDDKQYFAMQSLKTLVLGADTLVGTPSFGTIADLKKLNNAMVYTDYLRMLNNDQVYVSVSGDVEEATIKKVFEEVPFANRFQHQINILPEKVTNWEFQSDEKLIDSNQTKFNLAFNFPVQVIDEDYFAAITFNALFGGTPQSKLFLNVREKASLAYYASSSLDLYNGLLNVQTGIDGHNLLKVKTIVLQQLEDIQQGKFTEQQLEEIKLGLISDYYVEMDNQRSFHRRALSNALLQRKLSDQEWLNGIKNVTETQVKNVAKKAKLRATFTLGSEN